MERHSIMPSYVCFLSLKKENKLIALNNETKTPQSAIKNLNNVPPFHIYIHFPISRSQDSVVAVVIKLWAERQELFLTWKRQEIFFYLQSMQSGSGADPASCSMGIRCSFPRGKADECDADHPPPSSVKLKNTGSYMTSFLFPYMLWCLIKLSTGINLHYLQPTSTLNNI
jgi:hypothetical protein